jgi:hypothetical protein
MNRTLPGIAMLALAVLMMGRHAAESPRANAEEVKAKAKAPFVHTVIFTLKKDAPDGAADGMIQDAHEMLAKIPTVREVRCGRPAEKPKADAKASYDVGLLVLFDDAAGLKTYDEHPLHKEYVKKHLKNIELDKLHVYDFMDAKK